MTSTSPSPLEPASVDQPTRPRSARDSIAWKAGVAAATKAGTFIVNIVLLPAQATWLGGRTEAGVWLALVALAMSMMLFDFGIGQGVRNSVASFIAKGDDGSAREVISSSYVMLSAIVLPLAIVASVISVTLDWNAFLRTPASLAHGEPMKSAALILTWSIAAYLVLGIVNAALSAAELTQWPPIVSFVSNVLVLGALWALPKPADPATAMVRIAIVQGFCMVLPLVVATGAIYGRVLPQLRPSRALVRRQRMYDLVRPSVMFLVIQVGLLLLNGINEPIITRIDGPAAVFTYQAYYKLFSMVWIAYGIVVSPVWARMASSFHRDDDVQLMRLHQTMRKLALFATGGTVCLFFAVPHAMDIWLGHTPANVGIRIAFLVQTTLMVAYYAETCLANATDRLRIQTIVLGIGMLAKVPLSLVLGRLIGSWTAVLHVNSATLLALVIAQFLSNRRWLHDRGARPAAA